MEDTATILNILILLATASIGVYTARSVRRKTDAEATEASAQASASRAQASATLVETARELIEPLKERIAALEDEVKRLRFEIAEANTIESELRSTIADKNQQIQEIVETKNSQIAELRLALQENKEALISNKEERDGLRGRVQHLEDVCRRAGINGETATHEVM